MQFNAWLDAVKKRLSANRRRAAGTQTPPAMEHLEDRSLLSVSSFFVGGQLTVSSDADDAITIRRNPTDNTKVQVLANGTALSSASQINITQVTGITVNGGDGPNDINLTGVNSGSFTKLTSVRINGNAGNDTILGTLDLNDTIVGGDGNDELTGQNGLNSIDGGHGDDTISGGLGNDTILGYDGNDDIGGDAGNDSIVGGDGDDTLDGSSGADTVLAGDGNDTVTGDTTGFTGAGNDSLDGGWK